MSARHTLAGGLLLCALPALAQAPFRLADVNSTATPSTIAPEHLVVAGTVAYFAGNDRATGRELWKTDGTEIGTVRVKDIHPGSGAGVPDDGQSEKLLVSGGYVYFGGDDGASGQELWRSDGTSGGTTRVADICPGACDSDPVMHAVMGGIVYFTADNDVRSGQLWRTDGTSAGTFMVHDFFTSPSISNVVAWNGSLYFRANGELWTSDGTDAGTEVLKDVRASGSSDPQTFVASGAYLYFVANDGINGQELWRTDGTEAGTVLVKDVNPGSASSFIQSILSGNSGNRVFFTATESTTGRELWMSDGTTAGTQRLTDLCSGTCSGAPSRLMGVLGTTLFFGGATSSSSFELWKSNGTTTSIVRDIYPGSPGSLPTSNTESYGWVIGSTLFFAANDSVNGYELWKTDGSEGETVLVSDIAPGSASSLPSAGIDLDGNLLFVALDAAGWELWLSNGTDAGTTFVKNITPDAGDSSPLTPVFTQNGVFFSAKTPLQGRELWHSDTTTAGTSIVEDIQPGTFDGLRESFSPLFDLGGTVFFPAQAPSLGRELWKSDGTAAGTVIVKDISPGSATTSFKFFTNYNGTLVFNASETTGGEELWRSDGTADGTIRIRDIVPGSTSSYPGGFSGTDALMAVANAILVFTTSTSTYGEEPWRSDGTEGGTTILKDIQPGSLGAISDMATIGDLVFLSADDGVAGYELWKTDGTESGTQLVEELHPGSLSSGPRRFLDWSGVAVFQASTSTTGYEWWKSDGTPEGTEMLADVNPGVDAVNRFNTDDDGVILGDSVYFSGHAANEDAELWRIHLPTGAANQVRNICATCASDPRFLTRVGDFIYFQATDTTGGTELWRSDGTFAGTIRVADIEAGAGGSEPESLAARGNLLFFSAFTSTHGVEPYIACAAPTAQFAHTLPASIISATEIAFTVAPLDADGGPVPCYTGTVHITSSDSAATLPADFSFIAGQTPQPFAVTLRTPGAQSVTITDTVTGSITTSFVVNVGASPVHSTITALPVAIIANGTATSTITIRTKDATGADLTSGGGTLVLETSRGTISSPVDQGDGTYTATLTSSTVAGTATITATLDGTTMTNSTTVEFLPGAATQLAVTAPANAATGTPFTVTVTALDANGNTATSYTGTVRFSVNDTNPTLPPDTAFAPSDDGVRVFTDAVSLNTVDNRTLTVTDIANGSIGGVAIIAMKGSTSTVVTSSLSSADAGVSVTLTATVSTSALGGTLSGNVVFKDGLATIGSGALSGGQASITTSSLGWGPHSMTAVYEGNASFLTSTSSVFTQVIIIPGLPSTATMQSDGTMRVQWTTGPTEPQQVEIHRASSIGVFSLVGTVPFTAGHFDDATVILGSAYLYRIRVLDSAANPGRFGSVDTGAAVLFTDPLILPGTILIKAEHITALRAAIDGLRAVSGLGPYAYSRSVSAGRAVLSSDFAEMRAAVDEARALIPDLAPIAAYLDSTLAAGMVVHRRHLTDLRARVE